MSDKIKILNHKAELKAYAKLMDKVWNVFDPIGNLFINCRRQLWYAQLGKFIYDTYGEDIPEQFKKLRELIGKEIHSDGNSTTNKGADKLSTLAICYIGAYLTKSVLEPIFGEPLFHNKFGEGFVEDDKEGHPTKLHASYFLEILGIKIHLHYDRAGTVLSVGKYKGETTPAEIAFYLMIELVKAIHKNEKIENENTNKG